MFFELWPRSSTSAKTGLQERPVSRGSGHPDPQIGGMGLGIAVCSAAPWSPEVQDYVPNLRRPEQLQFRVVAGFRVQDFSATGSISAERTLLRQGSPQFAANIGIIVSDTSNDIKMIFTFIYASTVTPARHQKAVEHGLATCKPHPPPKHRNTMASYEPWSELL